MPNSASGSPDEALAAANATIASLQAELAYLRGQINDQQLAGDLRRAVTLAATSGIVSAPASHSSILETIVRVATDVIGARAASLFLIDTVRQDLVFEVAIGPKAAEVERFRVPLGHGVAGIVALTGQSMAVSDVQSDPRHASDISQSVGYLPESILCVPLFFDDQVIGVLELLDKIGAPSFGPSDMDLLGRFATLAAVAIEQSRVQRNLAALISNVLGSFKSQRGGGFDQQLIDRTSAFVEQVESDEAYRQSIDIARLVEEIAHQGESERAAVRSILQGFADYLRSRNDASTMLGLFQ